MKYRESGMPDEQLWTTFYSPEQILAQLDVNQNVHSLVDLGCGYGTFLLPAARLIRGMAIGIDIEPLMIERCKQKAQAQHLKNITLLCVDISTSSTKILDDYKGTINYITLFNILHCEQPIPLLKNAYKLLNNKGKVGVIHWKQEKTPRGPSMAIRPTPETICAWAERVGLHFVKYIELPPYHFGLLFEKL
ncbi:class I SAM-dependent methyltransferase [Sporolactobacillus spathodeae]